MRIVAGRFGGRRLIVPKDSRVRPTADRVREAYPGHTYQRLAAIKRRYDPNNLFRLNQNVPPAGTGAEASS